MFNEEACNLCGICLSECPFIEMPEDLAGEEMGRMIETKQSDVAINKCASCGYCNVICPTDSNPFDLIREIKLKHNAEVGTGGLFLISEDVPFNLFSMALDYETEEKEKGIKKYADPPKSSDMFYAGCALPHLFPDLAETSLLERFPIVGGMKYCCGGYVLDSFGEEEAKIKGRDLLVKFKELGVKRLITLCPGCDLLIGGVYPKLVEDFDIEIKTFTDYFIERHRSGDLALENRINKRIAFHDPCPWRGLDSKIYDSPRAFLQTIGVEVVEMEHNRENSLCCGFPPAPNVPPPLSEQIAARRVSEAKEQGVEAIAVNCVGCLNLSPKAAEMGIDTFHVIELAQMAIGETPAHRINETLGNIMGVVMKKMGENPNIMTDRYVARDGKIQRL
jgi:Fe-S oxidoreductase